MTASQGQRAGFDLRDVSTVAAGRQVLQSIDLHLPIDGITVVAGPSGSGKSSLLRLLDRLDAPSSGRITLDGDDLDGIDPCRLRRTVGFVFQHPVAFAGSVADNLRVADPDLDDLGVASLLDRVGLDGFAERDAESLSGGEAQRMNVARALATGPRVILADEPTSALDTDAARTLEDLAHRHLAGRGRRPHRVDLGLAQPRPDPSPGRPSGGARRRTRRGQRVASGAAIASVPGGPGHRRAGAGDMTGSANAAASAADISTAGLAASGILVAVAVAISLWRHLGLERSVLWACLRALVQLLAVGAALHLVVDDDDSILLAWLWVVAMVVFASWTTTQRIRARSPSAAELGAMRLFGLAIGSFTAAAAVSLGVLFGFGVFELGGRTLVPLAGMMVGNSLAATVLAATRVLDEAREQRARIEARLALGLDASAAFAPHLRAAVRQALIPQIETTKAVGIVFLPGAMVGLILAGADPTEAVKVQAAVMYLVLGSVATTTAVMSIGLSRQLFSRDHRLVVTGDAQS